MPGSSPTMERRLPVRRLKSVDLPTLGRPQMAKTGSSLTAAARLIGEDGARGLDSRCWSILPVRLCCSRLWRLEVGGGGLDAAGRGARLLPLIGRERGLLRGLRLGLHGLAGARAELGGALALRLQACFVGFAAALVACGAFAGGLLLLGFFRWQGGSFFPDARVCRP